VPGGRGGRLLGKVGKAKMEDHPQGQPDPEEEGGKISSITVQKAPPLVGKEPKKGRKDFPRWKKKAFLSGKRGGKGKSLGPHLLKRRAACCPRAHPVLPSPEPGGRGEDFGGSSALTKERTYDPAGRLNGKHSMGN